jgi:capsid protein
MKKNLLDKLVGFFSPRAELRRLQSRAAIQLLSSQTRRYDGAATTSLSDWKNSATTSANTETRSALKILRARARDLVRNNPYARRAVYGITNNIVGAGILANIQGRDEKTHQTTPRSLEAMVRGAGALRL